MSGIDELTRDWNGDLVQATSRRRSVELRGNRTFLERAYGNLSSNQKMALSVVLPIALILLPTAIAFANLEGSVRWSVLMAAMVSIAAMLVFGWVLSREILGVTNVLGNSLYRIADGETDFVVPCRDRSDHARRKQSHASWSGQKQLRASYRVRLFTVEYQPNGYSRWLRSALHHGYQRRSTSDVQSGHWRRH